MSSECRAVTALLLLPLCVCGFLFAAWMILITRTSDLWLLAGLLLLVLVCKGMAPILSKGCDEAKALQTMAKLFIPTVAMTGYLSLTACLLLRYEYSGDALLMVQLLAFKFGLYFIFGEGSIIYLLVLAYREEKREEAKQRQAQ